MALITLDHLDKIEMDTTNPLFSNLHALIYLPFGLFQIADYVRTKEIKLSGPNTPTSFMSFRNDPELMYIACQFHWFSISLVNYIRLIAFVKISNKNNYSLSDLSDKSVKKSIKKHCNHYVRSLIPNIVEWRNKIAAHFAITTPYEEDHIAFLWASAIMPVSYTKPYYYVSEWKPTMLPSTHDSLERWSLTATYEELTHRLWPQAKIQSLSVGAVE